VVRLACVDVPAFPLQIVLRRFPAWRSQPVAVVADERTKGKILWANGPARQKGIRPGMRFSTAATYAPTLRAGVVTEGDLTQSSEALVLLLQQFSPRIEPAQGMPGIFFWLDASGLLSLYTSHVAWGHAVITALHHAGWEARIVIGFSRFATAAVARATRQAVVVFATAEDETGALRHVPLNSLTLPTHVTRDLSRLGLRTAGDVLRFPRGSLRERFGAELTQLVRDIVTADWPPLQPWQQQVPLSAHVDLEIPESDQIRLLFLFRRLLPPLLKELRTRHHAATELAWEFVLDDHTQQHDQLRPAAPTLDIVQLIDLIRVRLATYALPAGVARITLTVHGRPASDEQLRLFSHDSSRDLSVTNRTLARVRAAFGEQSVVRARLREGHLPEAQFTWEVLGEITLPCPRPATAPTLVRRLLAQPTILIPPFQYPRHEGRRTTDSPPGAVTSVVGPYLISGGWWQGLVEREYAYVETRRGDLLLVFYDRRRRRWMLQGRVE